MKLTDTHLVLLSAAAQHQEHLLTRPDHINGQAAHNLTGKLIRAGLVEEVPVRPDQPHWRVHSTGVRGINRWIELRRRSVAGSPLTAGARFARATSVRVRAHH